MDVLLQALQVMALLCQAEIGTSSMPMSGNEPRSALEKKRLACISYYINCSCERLKSGNLSCSTSDIQGKLTGCALDRSENK